MKSLAAFSVTLLLAGPSWAASAAVQVEDLRDAGRVVITLDAVGLASVRQHGSQVDIAVPAAADVVAPDMVPRNVLSMVGVKGSARLTVAAGAVVKAKQDGRTLTIFILDPGVRGRDALAVTALRPNPGKRLELKQVVAQPPVPADTPSATAASPDVPNVKQTAAKPAPMLPSAPPAMPSTIPATVPLVMPQPVGARPPALPVPQPAAASPPVMTEPPSTASKPSADSQQDAAKSETSADIAVPGTATASSQPAGSESQSPQPPISTAATPPRPVIRGFAVRTGPDTGVAAFRLGGRGVVVFDEELSTDSDDVETTMTPTVMPIQHGTFMTVPLADDEALSSTRSDSGITVTIGASNGSPAATSALPTGVQFQIAKPGRVMAVSDPVSGQTMLIGTTRQLNGQHAIVDVGRTAPGYVLLPTWLGLALETSSDEIDLKASLSGYTLAVADKATTNATAPARIENQFGIPIAPTAVLMRQLNSQIASAAAAPARGRGPDRVAAARTMLALGMSAEADALLTLAATDDPKLARDPATLAVTGIAAILAGRPAEATGLDDPALPTGGDIALWRGLRAVGEGKPAPVLAGAWPLLSAYPDAIRQQVAPDVMEAAAENGADVPEADMQGSNLALSRALKLVHDGQTDAAIAALTAVKDSRDERDSVRAAITLAELQLRAGRANALETADQLERQTVRWRGDGQELSLRIRVAELRSQSGKWLAALKELQETQAVFPDSKERILAAKSAVFETLLAADSSKIAPLDMVLIASTYADELPGGDAGDRLAGLVADKLAALDLPTRAIPVLQKLIDKAQTPTAKGEYGLRLAQMDLDAGDAPAADALLSTMDSAGFSPARDQQRLMLLSQAQSRAG